MGLFGKTKKELESLCSVQVVADAHPLICPVSDSRYFLVYPMEVRFDKIYVLGDFTFSCVFSTKETYAEGFRKDTKDYLSTELHFYQYSFLERVRILSLLHEKGKDCVSQGILLSLTDAYVHEKLDLSQQVPDTYGNLIVLSRYRGKL